MKRPHFALPEIYDDSLSYYDVLRKLIKSMHAIVDNLNKIPEQIANEAKAREQADGTLQTNIDNEAKARSQADAVLDGKISELKGDLDEAVRYVSSENIFDKDEDGAVVYESWYSGSNAVGGRVSLTSNQYTGAYTAIKITLNEQTNVSIKQPYNNVNNGHKSSSYGWYIVDSNMNILSVMSPFGSFDYYNGFTFENIPSNAKYILINALNYNEAVNNGFELMVNVGAEAKDYVPYGKGYYVVDKADSINSNVYLHAPNEYDVISQDESFQIFYNGMLNTTLPEQYFVKAKAKAGNSYRKYFELETPTQNLDGDSTITFELYDSNNVKIDEKTAKINFSFIQQPASAKTVLCVGDSLTTGGVWVEEFHRRLTKTGGNPLGQGFSNITFIGTRQKNDANYEGYGGWNYEQYNTDNINNNVKIITCSHDKTDSDQHSIYKDENNNTWKIETIYDGSVKIIAISSEGTNFPSSGTLTWVSGGEHHSDIVYTASENGEGNPFWNSTTKKVDFANYVNKLGATSLDYVFVLLGWNAVSMSKESYKASAQTFINNLHSDFPNAKIVLIGLQIPSINGIGTNYSVNTVYDAQTMINHVFKIEEINQELAKENANVSSLNISNHFDTEHNMPTTTKKVNFRSDEKEVIQSNGVHPANAGYLQIADVVFRRCIALIYGKY